MHMLFICCPDIGYSLVTLAQFNTNPSKIHYQYLKRVALYLRQTASWGIIYWQQEPNMLLPDVPFEKLVHATSLPTFPVEINWYKLTGFVDAAYANNLCRHRSTTGYGFLLAGGVVSYRCQIQKLTAVSSTEAEFYAAISAAKVARYFPFILSELGFPQDEPTPLYKDNASTIHMVNARKPTERSRYIDICHFEILDWKERGDIKMHHIPGVINPSDVMTKNLG